MTIVGLVRWESRASWVVEWEESRMARKGWKNAVRVLIGALSLVVLGVFGMFASLATAATPGQSYGYTGEIGSPDNGSFAPSNFNAISVSNDDGNVFIIRQFDLGFDVLTPAGTSITRPGPLSIAPSSLAASPDGSVVFATDAFGPNIVKVTSDGAPTPTYTQDGLWTPGIALNQLGGIAVDPVTGDLVAGAAGGIYRFDAATGALLSSFDGSTSAEGAFTPTSIAIAPNGDIYAVAGPGRVEHMAPDGTWKGKLAVPTPETALRPSGVAVNPQNGDVAVEAPEGADTVIKLYTAANALKDTIVLQSPVAADNTGLAYSPDGSRLYIALNNGSAHVLTLGTRPGVDAPAASQIDSTEAHLAANVATDGEPSTAWIEWCIASDPCARYQTSDGASPWHRLSSHANLSSPVQDNIEDDLTGLAPNTQYLVRTYAINDTTKVEALSAAQSFTTALDPPVVTTGAASPDDTSAELVGTIDTFGAQTTYHFEYGLTGNYGARVPVNREGLAGSSRTPRTFQQTAKGLQPGTEYHYRLVATNAAGTSYGADRTFTTLGVDQVAPHRGYEQVTSPNKNGLAIFNNFGFRAAESGDGFAYSAAAGAADASSASQASRYLSVRANGTWSGQTALDPPVNPTRAINFTLTHAVSEDFKHALVVSQKALAPGAVEGSTNYYVTDVDTGAYHLVGSTGGPFSLVSGPLSAVSYIAGADDFSWVVLIARRPVFGIANAPNVAMYKWTRTGGLSLISRLPGGAIPTGDAWVQSDERTSNPLVSKDGETWAYAITSGGAERGVYLRRASGAVVEVSAPQVGPQPRLVQPGIVDGISRDGRYVVFQSNSQLTSDATDPGYKLYRYDADTGQLEYLGPLDTTTDGTADVVGIGNDGGTVWFHSNGQLVVWRDGQVHVVFAGKPSGYMSPNGRYLIYVDGGSTAHLHDAATSDDVCLSCTVDGTARPSGLSQPGRNFNNRQPQAVTDDGRAYFDTTAALISADHNGSLDVYEYYRGRRTLISPGDRNFTATLADISADGRTVFFTTSEGLVGQDTDQTYDVYAARVGGGLDAQNPASPDAPCVKGECGEPGPGPVISPPVGSSPQPGKSSKRTNQEKVRVSVTRVSVGSKTMKITFSASQRGRVTISGERVVRTYRNVTKEGTYSVSVRLSKKARSLQHAKKRFKLAVKVSLAGGWGTSSAKYSRTLNK